MQYRVTKLMTDKYVEFNSIESFDTYCKEVHHIFNISVVYDFTDIKRGIMHFHLVDYV